MRTAYAFRVTWSELDLEAQPFVPDTSPNALTEKVLEDIVQEVGKGKQGLYIIGYMLRDLPFDF